MADQNNDSDTAPRAPPSVMDSIPLEIAEIILENLLEYDLAPTPNAQYSEQPSDKLVWPGRNVNDDNTWVMIATSAKYDILSVRLACRKLYDASNKAFAKLLGDRKFRLTGAGMDDLAGISLKKELLPHIGTLTFGTAMFGRNRAFGSIDGISEINVSNLDRYTADRFVAGYHSCYERAQELWNRMHVCIASALKAFPQLHSLRIVSPDTPSLHLASWLSNSEDEDLLHRDHYLFHDRSIKALYEPKEPTIGAVTQSLYTRCAVGALTECLADAFTIAGTELRELRVS